MNEGHDDAMPANGNGGNNSAEQLQPEPQVGQRLPRSLLERSLLRKILKNLDLIYRTRSLPRKVRRGFSARQTSP